MSLEAALAANTAALIALTAALSKSGPKTVETGDGSGANEAGAVKTKGGGTKTADTKSGKTEKGDGEKVVAYPAVAAAVTKLAKEKGREAALAVLAEFDVKNAKDLPAGSFAAFIEKAEAALTADEDLA